MMKKYRVKVNDKLFEVEVEEISSAAVKEVKEEVKVETVAAENVSGEQVRAPLPGTITSIEVKVGDRVEEGDVLFIMEAMKMENEIPSPVSGTIKAIHIAQNASVDTGELLATIG